MTALQHEYDKETTKTVTAKKSSFLANIPVIKYPESKDKTHISFTVKCNTKQYSRPYTWITDNMSL